MRCERFLMLILLKFSAEVSAHPTDVTVRIRLLKFFLEFKRYQIAYEHALELEDRQLFLNDLRWYHCLCNVIEVCIL